MKYTELGELDNRAILKCRGINRWIVSKLTIESRPKTSKVKTHTPVVK